MPVLSYIPSFERDTTKQAPAPTIGSSDWRIDRAFIALAVVLTEQRKAEES